MGKELRESFGEQYLKSYAEIPGEAVQEEDIAVRKLSGHLRLFDPLNFQGALRWYQDNYEPLCVAYGKKRVDDFVDNLGSVFGVAGKDERG